MSGRVWLSVAGTALGGFLLAAASVAATGAGEARRGGTLRYATQRDVASLDPALAYDLREWELESATCANLFNYPDRPGPAGLRLIPEVARSFPQVSRDGKTHTIQLRRGYRFHTGQRVTAANYVAAFNRLADPAVKSPATSYLHEIAGADAVIEGRAKTVSGVTARGPYAILIRTTKRLPDLVGRLSMPFFCPIAVDSPRQEIELPLGSGPYYVGERIRNRRIVLKRNRFYQGARPAHVNRLVIEVGRTPEACVVAVERDEVDRCFFELRPHVAGPLEQKYGRNRRNGRFFLGSSLGTAYTAYFVFNHNRPAFAGRGQIPLKQAINHAIDRRAMVGTLGVARSTDQILPPGMRRDIQIYPLVGVSTRSLARARALRARARVRPGVLVLYTVRPLAPMAQVFKVNLRRIGIEVDVREFSLPVFAEKMANRDEPWDVALPSRWFPDYADPITFFAPLLKRGAPGNHGRFDRYNSAIERVARMTGKARSRAWADLDIEMTRKDPPWAPAANGLIVEFVSKSVGCFYIHAAYGFDIAAVCKK